MSEKKILVVGSANVDMVVRTPHIPRPGETILGGDFKKFEGGKGANQAVAANAICLGTAFCAGVGNDSFGHEYVAYLRGRGLDVNLVKFCDSVPTGVALITVSADGENAITVAPGANMELSEADMEAIDFSNFDIVLFQLENRLGTVSRGLTLAKKAGCTTILTPAPAQILPKETLPNIDYIVPNEIEILEILPDYTDAKSAAKGLLELGVKNVIITLGKRGCDFYSNERIEHFDTYNNIKPVDTVGAGDCFTGSFAAALKLFGDVSQAIKFANAAASLKVTKNGAQSVATIEEIKSLMK